MAISSISSRRVRVSFFVIVFTSVLNPRLGNASLIDASNGLINDTTLNIVWLKDANLAATESFGVNRIEQTNFFGASGIRPDGSMTWETAQAWIEAMNAAKYKGFEDWRLPYTKPVNGIQLDDIYSFDGSTDFGNNAGNSSELGHLFYTGLGNLGEMTTGGDFRSGDSGVDWGVTNSGPFENIQTQYWSATEYSSTLIPDAVWFFNTYRGIQNVSLTGNAFYAWAVRDGQIAAVPIPAAVMQLGSALICLAAMRRKQKKNE